ncbi:39S ribosomal protein L19, mitochondrial [Condylostylus longicornis]|uniref:39S ribosomal protein L19, mitochondrial n=1 Tax=Condylostylus longicornis TaxID=2530218 RepID=UPI00244E4E39|nr:39S ribosomal protein L19, mitochondrial [Condylostylus longicornis]
MNFLIKIPNNLLNKRRIFNLEAIFYSTKVTPQNSKILNKVETRKPIVPPEFRFIYPEFLPDPNIKWRNGIREKLERIDMLNRRANIDIPEFYVGSILAATSADPLSSGKTTRFVGICIDRDRCGLRSRFILRNVIDHQGIEIQYDMYDPTLQKIEVLRLEKRLDDKLFYLRDALPEFSTFDINMEAEILPEGSKIPINDIKVKLKPKPWLERWERQNLKGISNINDYLIEKHIIKAKKAETPWEKYDLMKEYRKTIPEEEQKEIYAEVYSQLHQQDLSRKLTKRKRTLIKPANLA